MGQKQTMLVVGLTGRMGAGKGTVAEYLKKKYGAEQFVYSSILSDILGRLSLPADRQSLQSLGKGLRDVLGSEVLVKAMREDVRRSKARIKLIDGIRYENEVEMLRSFENNILIFMDAPPDTRLKRIRARAEKGEADLGLNEFTERENAPTEKGLEKIEKLADYVLDNSGTIEELYPKVDRIIDSKGC